MFYNIRNVSNQFIECSLKDNTTLRLYPHTEVAILGELITPYLRDLESAGILVIEEIKSKEETPVTDEKKKSPKNDKKEEK